MKPLSPRERKLVAVALLLGVIALIWIALLQPVLDGFTERAEQRAELADRYAQNERLIGRIGQLRRVAEQQRLRTGVPWFGMDGRQAADGVCREFQVEVRHQRDRSLKLTADIRRLRFFQPGIPVLAVGRGM